MRLSKFGINLCALSRRRPLRYRELSYGPRDTDAELPDLRAEQPPKTAYGSPQAQQKPPNPLDKVDPQAQATKKIVPMPDLAHLMTYFEMFKSKPFWQKYALKLPKMPSYTQFQLPWKKY